MSNNLFQEIFSSGQNTHFVSPAIQQGNHTISYSDLKKLIQTAAGNMEEFDLRGNRAILCMPNCPEYIIGFFAILALEGIVIPLDPAVGKKRFHSIVKQVQPKLILYTDPLDYSTGVPCLKMNLDIEKLVLSGFTGHRWKSECESPHEEKAIILYSSGSTGEPKGGILTHDQLVFIAETLSGIVSMDPNHHEYLIAPMTHSGCLQRMTSTLIAGGLLVFPSSIFSIPTLLDDLTTFKISGFFSTPPLIRMLLKTSSSRIKRNQQSLKSIEIASAPLSESEIQSLLDLFPGCNVYFQYGLTECSRALVLDSRKYSDKLHTVGLPTNGVKICIADEQDKPLKPGQEGRILLQAYQLAKSYWGKEEIYRKYFRNQWFSTGDMGLIDSDGFLILRGRQDDMINCGGNSYFPADVEMEVGDQWGLADFIVVGVPDPQNILTQIPWIFVVPKLADNWDDNKFTSHLHQVLPPFMVPRNIVVIPEIPVTDSGKPSRKKVLDLYGPHSN